MSVVHGTLASLAQGILVPLAKRQIKLAGEELSGCLAAGGKRRAVCRCRIERGRAPRTVCQTRGAALSAFRRKEDNRLIRGFGRYVDDEGGASVFHMKLVRSPYAHARIAGIDVSRAKALDGVLCTLTGAEVAAQTKKFIQMAPPPASEIVDYCMATDKVRFQGEPVVAVVATSPAFAADAVELVRVDYEPLPAVTDAVASLSNEVLLHEAAGTNKTWGTLFDWGEVDTRLCRGRDRHRDRPAEISSLLVDPARDLCRARHLGGRRPRRYFLQHHPAGRRDEIHGAGARRLDRADPHPHP